MTARPTGQEAPVLALGAAILPGPGLGGGGPWNRGARAHGEGVLRAEHPIGLPEVLGRHGRSADAPRDETGRFARGEESRGSNATSGNLGRGRSYTLARLRRDRPELAERVRAGGRLGELLDDLVQRGGDRAKSPEVTLQDLGVSRNQSSKWQQLAKTPREVLERPDSAPEAGVREGDRGFGDALVVGWGQLTPRRRKENGGPRKPFEWAHRKG